MTDAYVAGFAEAQAIFGRRTVEAPLDSHIIDSPIIKSRTRDGKVTLTIWDAKCDRHRTLTGARVPVADEHELLQFVFYPDKGKCTVKDKLGKIFSFNIVRDAPTANGLRTA